MITESMRKYLESIKDGEIKDRRKHNIYLRRIQKRIDREEKQLIWLTKTHPNLFLDEEREYEDETLERHRRLKALIKALQNLNPKFAVELRIVEEERPTKPDWWPDQGGKWSPIPVNAPRKEE